MDLESLDRWDAYTTAKEAMIEHTDTDQVLVDLDQEQRQEARSNQRDAVLPESVRLRGQEPVGGLPRGSPARTTRPRLDQGLTQVLAE